MMRMTCRFRRSDFTPPVAGVLAIALALTGALPGLAPAMVHAADVTPPPPPPPRPPIVGFVDTHLHQFANLGFGGLELWGSPMDPTRDLNASPATAAARAFPPSDFLYLTEAQVSDYLAAAGLPVTSALAGGVAVSCDDGSCWAECPAGTGVQGSPCWRLTIQGTGGRADLVNKLVGGVDDGHAVAGFPDMDGFSAWHVLTVQQAYWEWLRRARDHGLKLMVMLAVNSAVLCNLGIHKASYGCDDDGSVTRQIQGAKDLEAYIDARSGGPGRGFYKVVYSSDEARQAIQANKLAVVLGTEVDTAWGCTPGNASCDGTLVQNQVQAYYDQGIRVVYPVHLIDNAFGGAAQYSGMFELNNRIINGSFFDIGSACDSEIEWRSDIRAAISQVKSYVVAAVAAFILAGGSPIALAPLLAAAAPVAAALPFVDLFLPVLGTVLPTVGATVLPLVALILAAPGEVDSPPKPNCNKRSLTPAGETLINALIDRHMIVDIDHTDAVTMSAIMDIAEARKFSGIVSGHTGLVGAGLTRADVEAAGEEFNAAETARHEGNKTDAQVQRILNAGGFISLILHQGSRTRIRDYSATDDVRFDCGESSESWAQVYLYATGQLGMNAVGIGSDLNGFAGMPAPRFGPMACGNRNPAHSESRGDYDASTYDPNGTDRRLVYTDLKDYYGNPLSQYAFGSKTWDYNVDGFANAAMYPDFVADLEAIKLSHAELAPLFNSAEAYVRMWERADDDDPPVARCGTVGEDWHAADVTVPCNAYDIGWGLSNPVDASFSLSTAVPEGTETDNASTGTYPPICDLVSHCTSTIPALAGINVDKKDPVVVVTTPAAGTPAYTLNEAVLADYACSDGGSGVAACSGPVASGAAVDTSIGSHAFAVVGADKVAHSVTVAHPYNVTFKICPLYDAARAKKAGSTFPIRLQLCDAGGANASASGIVLTATGVTRLSDNAPGALEDAGESNPDSNFRYDALVGGYVFNLQTTGLGTGTYGLTFRATGDPLPHTVEFQLR